MPFTTISAPRKISDLNAEVRAAAYIRRPGLVAMLSNSPVRLATFTFGGAAGKVNQVALDEAVAVALLTRDVAVVVGSDDSVWGLIDITHTPKMHQVARDVRALAFRPNGGTALALGWDGSVNELSGSRNEVENRQFRLHDSIRAIDHSETETYVIADGADGGQLRVHPGSTPEAGVSLRVNLPREVASFDDVRGGPRLCAVWKPGSQTVCLATGGPTRLVAKLVELEDAPTALGVLETSLLVTFADGRVSLYDSEAIASTGESGPLTPKHTMSLGSRGKPQALILTSTGELWVGTSTGEVLSASVV